MTDERFFSKDVMAKRDIWVLPGKESIIAKKSKGARTGRKRSSWLGRELLCNLTAFEAEVFLINN